MKLDKQPKCSLCNGEMNDVSYVFLANAKGKGGHLVHKACWNDSRREEMEALREVRKQVRLSGKPAEGSQDAVVQVGTLKTGAKANL